MKKLFSFLTLLLVSIFTTSAAAATITVNVDSKDRVEFGYNYKMYGFLDMKEAIALENDGENTVELPDNANSVYVSPKGGYQITSVKVDGEDVAEEGWSTIGFTDGMVITVTSEEKAASAYINFSCDDYTLVTLNMRNEVAPRAVELTSNECQIGIYDGDFALEISSANSEKPILKVLRDGNEVAKNWGYWLIEPLTDGVTVQVITEEGVLPTYPVSFDFSDDHAKEYITSVTVNDEVVEDYAAGFEAKENSLVTFTCNTEITDVKVKVNGEEQTPNLFGKIFFSVTAATTVEVYTVAPPAKKYLTVNLDNASVVEVGYKEDYESFFGVQERSVAIDNLVDGDNSVEIGESWKCLYVKTTDALYELVAVTVDDAPVADDQNIAIAEDMVLKVTTQHVAPVGTVTLNCDDFTAVIAAVRGENGERIVPLETASTAIDFYATDFALAISAASSEHPIISVTCNGEAVSGSNYYIIDPLADGMNVVVTTIPEMYNVKFEFSDDNARNYITSVTCGGAVVEAFDAEEGFDVAEKSTLVLSVDPAISNVVVTANDVELHPVSIPGSSFITLDVNANTVIKVESQKAKAFTVTLDHADFVNVGWNKPHSYIPGLTEKVLFEGLVDGENTIEIPANCTTVFVEPASTEYEITEITLDGAAVQPVLYGEMPVVDGTVIAVASHAIETGIDGIIAKGNSVDVYTIDGKAVLKAADANALRALPAGHYIIGGSKVSKR